RQQGAPRRWRRCWASAGDGALQTPPTTLHAWAPRTSWRAPGHALRGSSGAFPAPGLVRVMRRGAIADRCDVNILHVIYLTQKKYLHRGADVGGGRREGLDPRRRAPPLEGCLQLLADRLQLVLEVPALRGEHDPYGPPIVGVILPHHQRAPLQAIEMAGERGAVEAELVREILHMHAVPFPQAGQQEEMVIRDPERAQPSIVELRDPSGRDVQEKADMLVQ